MTKKSKTGAPAAGKPKVEKQKPFFRPFEVIAKPKPAAEAKSANPPKGAKPPSTEPPASRPSRPLPEAPALSPADEVSFHQLMYGVSPLDKSRGQRVPTTVDKLPEPRLREFVDAAAESDAKARAQLRALVEGAEERFEVIDDGEHLEGRRADTSGKLFRSLRRGELTIDARLDLHGMALEDARVAVDQFLRISRARGERVGLVIHGRGAHSPGGLAVLRGEIAAWLSQGPASACVEGFCTAVRDDGGEGALYILLRR
jgi:DNA-nicking Smr family endonuclease